MASSSKIENQPAALPSQPENLQPDVQALLGLSCMEHRGACSADDVSGDGSGVMTKVPWALLKKEMPDLNEDTTGCAAGSGRAGAGSQRLFSCAACFRGAWRVGGQRARPCLCL